MQSKIDLIRENRIKTVEYDEPTMGCHQECMNNVVPEETLKKIQQKTLRSLKEYLSKTYGPMGSYTAIISGNNAETIQADYSKDGLIEAKFYFQLCRFGLRQSGFQGAVLDFIQKSSLWKLVDDNQRVGSDAPGDVECVDVVIGVVWILTLI